MRRRGFARYESGPFVIVRYNDRSRWDRHQVGFVWTPGHLLADSVRHPAEAYRAVEEHLGTSFRWELPAQSTTPDPVGAEARLVALMLCPAMYAGGDRGGAVPKGE